VAQRVEKVGKLYKKITNKSKPKEKKFKKTDEKEQQ
jgi:hypothetical protein